MLDRQKRLNEVYEHLHNYFNIHTKGDFADSIKYARAYISSALNGNEKYLTDKLFTNICDAYPGVFDLNYLLTGEGSLLTIDEEIHNEELEKLYNPQPIDQSSLVNALLAAKDETIGSLKSRIEDLQRTIAAKEETIATKNAQLADKDRIIEKSEQTVKALQDQIADLRHLLAQKVTKDELDGYPFSMGAAEDKTNPKRKRI